MIEGRADTNRIESCTFLVYKCARKVTRRVRAANYDDVVGAGMVGLCEAATRYRVGGARFSTFAYQRIYGAMLDHVRGESCWMGGARYGGPRRRSLDVYRMPLAAPHDPVSDRIDVDRLLATLPDRPRRLMVGVHLHGRELQDVSRELGIKKSWGSRILSSAIADLGSRAA